MNVMNIKRMMVAGAAALAFALTFTAALAQDQAAPAPAAAGIKTLGISDVKITKALSQANTDAGKKASLDRVAQALDGQLIDRFQQTRKFKIIARSDLDTVLKEQGLSGSGNLDASDPNAAKSFAVKGVQYLLVTSIDDFQDFNQEAKFATLGDVVKKRVVRLSAIGKLYDSTTGELLESTNFQIKNTGVTEEVRNSTKDGELSDALLLQTVRDMADKMSNRVTDVIFPARILAVSGTQVTLNRGDGTGIAVGQVWVVHKLGEEMIDPDTKESLGREEVVIGKVRVTSVAPKFAKAEIIEGNAIAAGGLLRPEASGTAVPAPK